MKIVVVEGMDPFQPAPGGIEGYTRNLLSYLNKAKIQAMMIGVDSGGIPPVNTTFDFTPVVHSNNASGYRFILDLVLKTPFIRLPLSAIIHAQRPEYLIPFILFHSSHRRVVTLHGRMLESVRLKANKAVRIIYALLEPFALKHADLIIAVDQSTKDYYLKQYPQLGDKIKIVHVGIDVDKFKLLDRDALRINYGFKAVDKVIVYLGRLEKEKNLDFLLKCFSTFVVRAPSSLLVFVGEGRERKRLEDLVLELGLANIIFMGAQEPERVPEILNCADVLTLCSMFEGSPTVIKEALACGVPVVSTDVGDVRLVIRTKTIGRIVQHDEKAFVAALGEILSTEDREQQRRDCVEGSLEFSFDNVGAKTVLLYEGLAVQSSSKKAKKGKSRW